MITKVPRWFSAGDLTFPVQHGTIKTGKHSTTVTASSISYERCNRLICASWRLLLFILIDLNNQSDQRYDKRTVLCQHRQKLEQLGVCNIVHATTPNIKVMRGRFQRSRPLREVNIFREDAAIRSVYFSQTLFYQIV